MKKIRVLVLMSIALITLSNCTSKDDKVKEYREITEKMAQIKQEIVDGTKNQEVGVKQMTELQLKLMEFEDEISNQYSREEKMNKQIEKDRIAQNKKNKLDSLKQDKLDKKKAFEEKQLAKKNAREEEFRLKAEQLQAKKEVAEMVRLEEQAELNAYYAELKEKGIFLVSFDGETFEVNQKDWDDWKATENYDPVAKMNEMKGIVNAMGSEKANGLANSMYRTLSKGIGREGISMKAVQGIQIYDVITKGETQYN